MTEQYPPKHHGYGRLHLKIALPMERRLASTACYRAAHLSMAGAAMLPEHEQRLAA